MNERLAAIFASLPASEITAVAEAVLGAAAGPRAVRYSEITTPHADPRTIGIVRVWGSADISGSVRDWSCVTKLIDMAVPNTLGTTVDPRNEALIYERGHFANGEGGLRPARCYHISRPTETLTILWLEDLTGAEGPPFGIDQLSEMAQHLGEWNARMAADPPAIDFPIGSDFHLKSAAGFDFPSRVAALHELGDNSLVRDMYAHHPTSIAADYISTYLKLTERSKTLPHALSLADCPVSNFFHLPGETIAIDWAGLGSEPLGADGGRFIGSATTWGRQFARAALRERELFESYLAGMRKGGATEERNILRSGYLCEMGFYLCTTSILPVMVASPQATLTLSFLEKRFAMPVAEFGTAFAPVIDLLPSYIEEIDQLLD